MITLHSPISDYVVQGHRFDIIEDFGCQPESYVSLPEFFLVWLLPILSCLGTFIFGGGFNPVPVIIV